MRKVLVPIDGSDCATRALKHAVRLAQASGSTEIHIVHAYDPPTVHGQVAVYLPEEKARCEQMILAAAIDMARSAGVPFSSDVLVGDIPEMVMRYAEEKQCDGIVMGTRGMGAIGNLLLGSVATKVIHLTKLPVTLIK